MPFYYSLLAAVLPMLGYLYLIWRADKYEREPVRLVLKNYFYGALGAVIFAYIGSTAFAFVMTFFTKNNKIVKFNNNFIFITTNLI